MTREEQSTPVSDVMELLAEQGLDGMPNAIRILLNEAMKIERAQTLGAAPYERSQSVSIRPTTSSIPPVKPSNSPA